MKELSKESQSQEELRLTQAKKQTQVLFSKLLHKGEKVYTIDIRYNSIMEAPVEGEVHLVDGLPVSKKKIKLEAYKAYVSAINEKNALRKWNNSLQKEMKRLQSNG